MKTKIRQVILFILHFSVLHGFVFVFVLLCNVCVFYPIQSGEEEQEEEEEDYEIPQWRPVVDYDPSVYEELKPRLSLPSHYLIVEESEEPNNNTTTRRLADADICPEDDNEYEPIQSPVCSCLPATA